MAIVIEFLSRNFHTTGHKVVDGFSASIGRQYNCDVHLDDPYVCPVHLEVEQDPVTGDIHITDNQSINGVKVNGDKHGRYTVKTGDVITLGRTHIRILDSETRVSPTLPLSALEENIAWMGNLWVSVTLTIFALASLLLEQYLTTYDTFKLAGALSQSLGFMLVFSLWPLAFALLSKLSKKEPKLAGQFSLIWLVLLLLQVLSVIEVWLSFNMLNGALYDFASIIIAAVIFFVFCWFSLFIAFHQPQQVRNRVASALTLALVVPMTFFHYHNTSEFSEFPSYDVSLMPPVYQIKQPETVDSLIDASGQLFEQIQKNEGDNR